MILFGDNIKISKKLQIPGMCQGETENINGNISFNDLMMGDNNNNNNFFTNYVSPHCSCMNGSRRVRKRHPATVQTPGRVQEMLDGDVMEPLVSYLDRLEPGGALGPWGGGGRGGGGRDFNDNLRCDDKGFETQFVMEFSHLKMGSQRHGSYEECATQDLGNRRLLSSTSKLK